MLMRIAVDVEPYDLTFFIDVEGKGGKSIRKINRGKYALIVQKPVLPSSGSFDMIVAIVARE